MFEISTRGRLNLTRGSYTQISSAPPVLCYHSSALHSTTLTGVVIDEIVLRNSDYIVGYNCYYLLGLNPTVVTHYNSSLSCTDDQSNDNKLSAKISQSVGTTHRLKYIIRAHYETSKLAAIQLQYCRPPATRCPYQTSLTHER